MYIYKIWQQTTYLNMSSQLLEEKDIYTMENYNQTLISYPLHESKNNSLHLNKTRIHSISPIKLILKFNPNSDPRSAGACTLL